jgi:hypothetical protein
MLYFAHSETIHHKKNTSMKWLNSSLFFKQSSLEGKPLKSCKDGISHYRIYSNVILCIFTITGGKDTGPFYKSQKTVEANVKM